MPIGEVFDTEQWETVYNLRVADFHTYFVGEEAWGFSAWAHNQYAPLVRPNIAGDGALPYPTLRAAGNPIYYHAYENVHDNGRPAAPAGLTLQVDQARALVLQIMNRLRENLLRGETQSVKCLSIVLRNGHLEYWVSGSGDESRVDSKFRSMIRTLLQQAGVNVNTAPIYWIDNPYRTGNATRANDAERHQLREISRLHRLGDNITPLAIGSTIPVCQACENALVAAGDAYAIAVPTLSGDLVAGND